MVGFTVFSFSLFKLLPQPNERVTSFLFNFSSLILFLSFLYCTKDSPQVLIPSFSFISSSNTTSSGNFLPRGHCLFLINVIL
ncbi:hypothetical protein Lalb_Chr02g0148501 [Lupinus albus]|uniref:Uncharacterized protein n=1 Tax=Lupinus albus TaxID=3870 RepID=A0A6A4R042_LUPAL|nr:hypothetical protein Lalb_Chr02g0148501 [Lupinus albus]